MPDHRRDEPAREADPLLLQVGRSILDNVAVLFFGSILLLVAAYPGLFLATSTSWAVAWPVLILCTGPVWAGIVAAAGYLLDGDAVTPGRLLGLVRHHAWAGFRIALVPAVVGGIFAGSLQVLDRNPDARWLAIPLLLDTGVAIVVGTALVPVFTLATARGLSGQVLWLASVGVVLARPVPVLGTITIAGIVAWAALVLGPAMLVFVTPLAILCAAVTRDAVPAAVPQARE